jgi:DNA modification methylase
VTTKQRQPIEVERFPLAKLVEDSDNPRLHPAKNLEAIKASLTSFGQVEPLVVQAKGLRVIGGNGRLQAMKDLGWEEADVVRVKLSDSKARALAIALNRTGELAAWNEATLVKLLDQISGEFPHEALGFTLDDLDFGKMLDPGTSKVETDLVEKDESDVGLLDSTPTVKPGELWLLGRHRLLCGDSFNAEAVSRLLDTKRADLVVTDPPFAIYGSSTGIGSDIADDKMVRPFFEQLGRAVVSSLKQFGHAYFCCDWRSYAAIWDGLARSGLRPKNCIVWDKGGGGLGASYANTHEFVAFFAHLPPATAMKSTEQRGQRTVYQPNIYRCSRVTGDERQHNAAKPRALLRWLIENSSEKDDIVLDLFGGSGSTLVAAEDAGRSARVMEIEPKWCDVVIRRWEKATGQTATRADA